MPQTVQCNLFLYADDLSFVFQYKDVVEIERQLNKDFASKHDWFVYKNLSTPFCKDRAKCIILISKQKGRRYWTPNITSNATEIKYYSKLTYLGCILFSSILKESIAWKILKNATWNLYLYIGRVLGQTFLIHLPNIFNWIFVLKGDLNRMMIMHINIYFIWTKFSPWVK